GPLCQLHNQLKVLIHAYFSGGPSPGGSESDKLQGLPAERPSRIASGAGLQLLVSLALGRLERDLLVLGPRVAVSGCVCDLDRHAGLAVLLQPLCQLALRYHRQLDAAPRGDRLLSPLYPLGEGDKCPSA